MIVLPRSIRDGLVGRARAGAPEEVCGVLGGTFDREASRVASSHPTTNAAANPRTRYRLDPEEQLRVLERLEDDGEEPIGFYHSHPRGPPGPSETDRERATWPDRSYVIVSLEPTTSVGSWRWRRDEEAFERERVVLE